MLLGLSRRILIKSAFYLILLSFFSASVFAVGDELQKSFSKAQALVAQGQLAAAIRAYQSIIHSNPQLPEAYNNLAAIYLKQKKTKQAKVILEQGLHAHKGYAALYDNLKAINVAMARDAYSKALQIDLKPSAMTIASLSVNKSKNTPIKTGNVSQPVAEKTITDVVEAKEKPLKNESPSNNKEISKVLRAWSAAWSAQAVDVYLSFYHKQFKPTNGMSHKSWVQSRRYRLKKPSWINVVLSELNVEKKSDKQAVVTFKQLYKSNGFEDISSKQIVLFYTEDGWQIFREKSI